MEPTVQTLLAAIEQPLTRETVNRVKKALRTMPRLDESILEHLPTLYRIVEEDPDGLAELVRRMMINIIEGDDPYGESEELLIYLCSDDNINTRSLCRLFAKNTLLEIIKNGFATRLEEQNALRIAARCLADDPEVVEAVDKYQPRSGMGEVYKYVMRNPNKRTEPTRIPNNPILGLFPRTRTRKVSVYCPECESRFESAIVIDPKRDRLGFAEYYYLPQPMIECLCHCKREAHAMERLLELTTKGRLGAKKSRIIASALAWCAHQPKRLREYQHAVFRLSNALFIQARWGELFSSNRTHLTIAVELWNRTIPALIRHYTEPHHTGHQRKTIRKSIEMLIGYTLIVSEPIPEAIQYARSPKPIPDELWRSIVHSAIDYAEFHLYRPQLMAVETEPDYVEECLADIERRCSRWLRALTPP